MSQTEVKSMPNWVRFAFGGSAGMGATSIVQPLDLIKTRMQIASSKSGKVTTGSVIKSVIKNEGFKGFYAGLTAALFRQATYTTGRMGVYTSLFDYMSKRKDSKAPGFFSKAAMGMTAGACGAFIGTPAEICLIRMTTDGRLPMAERRGYKNVVDAVIRITREEGLTTLWRGTIPTMGRAMVLNGAQLATYSQAKQTFLTTKYFHDGIFCHFVSSMVSGLASTIASMPVDIAKTRIQNMKTVNGVSEYKNGIDVVMKIIKKEGFLNLWKGFIPYYAKLGPHTVLTFIFLEQMNTWYNVTILGISGKGSGL